MPPRPEPATAVLDPILLWILIHGGDPAPDKQIARLANAAAIYQLAGRLGTGALRTQIREAAANEIQEAAGALGRK
jgi:hypothetical protein